MDHKCTYKCFVYSYNNITGIYKTYKTQPFKCYVKLYWYPEGDQTDPLREWIASGEPVKFVGDVNKKRGVRDIRSDHQGYMLIMYSMLVVKTCVKADVSHHNSSLDARTHTPSCL